MNSQYDVANLFKIHEIRQSILSKRGILLNSMEVYIDKHVITLYGDIDTCAGWVQPIQECTLILDWGYYGNICKERLLQAMGLDPTERYYIGIGSVLVNIDSYLDPTNAAILSEIRERLTYMNYEFEDFYSFVEYDIYGYLEVYKEDDPYNLDSTNSGD